MERERDRGDGKGKKKCDRGKESPFYMYMYLYIIPVDWCTNEHHFLPYMKATMLLLSSQCVHFLECKDTAHY